MSHYIYVTAGDQELKAHLNLSGDLSELYEALDASKFNRGTNGDGNKPVSRKQIENAKGHFAEDSIYQSFFDDVLSESDSSSFIFYFS